MNKNSIAYLNSYKVSTYTGDLPSTVGSIPAVMIFMIGIGVLGAYASNKFCMRADDDIPADYLTAGAKPNETANWHVVAIEMLDRNIEEAPKNAPKAFQIDYLDKIDEIRRA